MQSKAPVDPNMLPLEANSSTLETKDTQNQPQSYATHAHIEPDVPSTSPAATEQDAHTLAASSNSQGSSSFSPSSDSASASSDSGNDSGETSASESPLASRPSGIVHIKPKIKSFEPKIKKDSTSLSDSANALESSTGGGSSSDFSHNSSVQAAPVQFTNPQQNNEPKPQLEQNSEPQQEQTTDQAPESASEGSAAQQAYNSVSLLNEASTAFQKSASTGTMGTAAGSSGSEQEQTKTISSSSSSGEAAVYDGSQASEKQNDSVNHRKHVFLRSLQFRIIWIVILAGFISMTIMSILSYYKITQITHDFVDEELSQIASVAINYRMIIPRRWEAPRHYHDRIMNLIRTADGSIVVQLSMDERNRRIKELTNESTTWFDDMLQSSNANAAAGSSAEAAGSNGSASQNQIPQQGQGMGRGMGAGMGYGMGPGMGQGMAKTNPNRDPNIAKAGTPSLSDLSGLNYDIMIAPLFGRPGDALYIPLGVSDGFYTVLVADERVRAFVATNANGQRFVVARPLSSLTDLIKQSFYASFYQFFWIDLIGIPLIIILSVNFMLRSLNRIAQDLYQRSEEDLSPVVAHDGSGPKGFIPSELDGFIISINRLFQRVDESMQSKRRFIADAAHEMRTQSTVLSLQIAALDNEELSPSARKKIKRLKEGIAREKSLMTSLLTLAREQGCSDLSLENINIFELYTKLIEEQGLVADNKNIDLGVEGEVNYTVISDRSRLTRIMSNLLSNAIKYTPEDGRIDLKAEQLADGSLVLTVQDDGPGIPPEHLKHILEPFYRVDGDRSAVQGTGLGLAIVKASCDSLKAQLKFANATPHGLIASVTLKDLKPTDIKDSSLPNSGNTSKDKAAS